MGWDVCLPACLCGGRGGDVLGWSLGSARSLTCSFATRRDTIASLDSVRCIDLKVHATWLVRWFVGTYGREHGGASVHGTGLGYRPTYRTWLCFTLRAYWDWDWDTSASLCFVYRGVANNNCKCSHGLC